MVETIVRQCFHRRGIVALVFVFICFYGYYCWKQIPLEAYPDIAPTTSQVVTQVNGLAAEEVEQQITIPLEREIMGTPGISIMRSRSTFGLSLITVVFQDGSEDYWSRQRLLERINNVNLPYGAQPGLDALTSPIGEIYRYTLDSKTRTLRELSELQFWKVIPRLKQVPGVTDITNFGGVTTQFLLEFDPIKLAKYHLSLGTIIQAINNNNANAGGSIMVRGEQGIVVRGVGLIRSLEDFANTQVTQDKGVPVFIKDIGKVTLGYKQRHGIVGKDNNPDVIEGIVLLLKKENPSRVMKGVQDAINELNEKILPKDVKVVPYLNRSDLVNATVHTVGKTLFDGMTMVTLVLLFFLGSVRAAAIVAITIPISLLVAFILMYNFNIPANLLSLGAIDFGIIVDGAIVVMENILRRREANEEATLTEEEVLKSSLQVTQPIFFGILVIITAYSVLFAFQQIEYKLFSPMAFAVGFALIGALLVALTLIPGLAYWAYHNPIKIYKNRALNWLLPRYEALLRRLIGRNKLVVSLFAVTLVLVTFFGMWIGRDFLPYLDEGSIWLQVTLPPGISLERATEMANEIRSATLEFKEVDHVISQVGRNDEGTDPFTPSHIECAITLHPYNTWKSGWTKQDLIRHLSERYMELAGVHVAFSQPMIDGVLDKVAGAHSDLVVKIFGNNLIGVRKIANSAVRILRSVPGAKDVIIDQEPPMTEFRIDVDRKAIARLGINISDIMDVIQTGIGGNPITKIYIEDRSYDVTARFMPSTRSNPQAIGNLLLTASNGAQIALSQLAKIKFIEGQTTITREMNKRQLTVRLNLRGRDLASFTEEAQKRLENELHYDHTRYQITWGGQLENQRRAQARLAIIIPMLLGLMFVLLFSQFGNLRQPGLILSAVPLAMVGGLIALLARGMTFNVSSAVGFIALFGVAVLNAIIMIANLNRWQRQPEISSLKEAVVHGAKERMRPVLMTATVAAIGMIPAASAHGLGSDVQRPLATVIVGGLITATALTLILLPGLYYLIEERFLARKAKKAANSQGKKEP
ncbi:efflux RND transporter permease subunit [Legionella maceachernii]|uniref:Multidrug efflux pump n=1 Tax=Legionella maceachernii TaxID=466 RepID=A0A0W0WHS5_9GAMM|nr:CusA/CzcA family heavy metal efflux RND transporter [Legionella maceachernii]KTD31900.1 multidrug efflux pump [Legionella maceachernii]SJZ44911.1 cobalt-zinc-cadmium resistance protein CzcA [Legionella maceachernii]SUP04126.1 Cation efflux system protein CzcA [Legionella maceachernii]